MIKRTAILVFFLFLLGCSESPVVLESLHFDFEGKDGVFIVNEGNFMFGNSSLSFFSTGDKVVYNEIFLLANEIPLGDVAQSICLYGDTAFVIVNNSGRIYRIDQNSAGVTGEIGGLVSPRNMLVLGPGKAYISDLYEKAITIADPEKCLIKGRISLDNGDPEFNHHTAEQMLLLNGRVFTNSWNYDAMILAIDPETDQLSDSVEVIAQPNSMAADRNGDLWVLCDGGFPGNPFRYEAPGLIRIDPSSCEVTRIYRFEEGTHPFSLKINGRGDTLYFINRDVWRMEINATALPEEPFVKSPYSGYYQGGFYGLGIDPVSSMVYVSDAVDHLQRGVVFRYRPDGVAVDSFRAGINPGELVFRRSLTSRKNAFP